MPASTAPRSPKNHERGAGAPNALQFLLSEHRRLLKLLCAKPIFQPESSRTSTDGTFGQICLELLRHLDLKDEILFPAIQGISCPSAWGIVEESLRQHKKLREQIERLSSSSLKEVQRSEWLHDLHDTLAKVFSDEEGRLLDEARRHLSSAELSDLAERMIAQRGSSPSELP